MNDRPLAAAQAEAHRRRRCRDAGLRSAYHADGSPITLAELDGAHAVGKRPMETTNTPADERAPLILRLPMPPTLTNSGDGRSRHWRSLDAERSRYWVELDAWREAGRFAEPPDVPIARARIASLMILGAGMDDDNATARHKWVIDWLVARRYLLGDRKKHLVWAGMPVQIVTRRHYPSITLTILPEA